MICNTIKIPLFDFVECKPYALILCFINIAISFLKRDTNMIHVIYKWNTDCDNKIEYNDNNKITT